MYILCFSVRESGRAEREASHFCCCSIWMGYACVACNVQWCNRSAWDWQMVKNECVIVLGAAAAPLYVCARGNKGARRERPSTRKFNLGPHKRPINFSSNIHASARELLQAIDTQSQHARVTILAASSIWAHVYMPRCKCNAPKKGPGRRICAPRSDLHAAIWNSRCGGRCVCWAPPALQTTT